VWIGNKKEKEKEKRKKEKKIGLRFRQKFPKYRFLPIFYHPIFSKYKDA